MTTSTSRSASAAPTASAWPGRKAGKPNSSCSAPTGSVARATGSGGGGPRPGRASVEAASMGRRTLPPAPEGSRPRVLHCARSVGELMHMDLDAYLAELARRLRELLGDDLLGVYAGGSYALGAYEPGRSDVDVTAVAAGPLAPASKRAVVERVRHEALACPARGLELVVYPLAATRAGGG